MYEVKDVKAWLKSIIRLRDEVGSIKDELVELDSVRISATKLKEVNVQESHSHRDLSDKVIQVSELMVKLSYKQQELAERRIIASQLIDELEDQRYRIVLRKYYLGGKTFEQIAVDGHWGIRSVYNHHGQALVELTALANKTRDLILEF